jgi:hypothetical protein
MHGMQRGNAGLAFGGLWAGAASAMELALLCLAGLEGRLAALSPCPVAACCAAQAFDFHSGCDQVLIHGSQKIFHIVELSNDQVDFATGSPALSQLQHC